MAALQSLVKLRAEVETLRRAIMPLSSEEQGYAINPATWAKESFSLDLDPWQLRALLSNSKRQAWNVHRQGGKSSVAALKGLHRAVYRPGSLVIIIAPVKAQSGELFRKLMGYYDTLDRKPALVEDKALSCMFDSGSRIIALSGDEDTTRSFSAPSLIIEDEAARCTDGLYYGVRPMLAVSNGDLLLLSTPKGKRGHFHKIWTEEPGWEKIIVTADQCPRISEDFLNEERVLNPLFLQEYMGVFLDNETQLFSSELIESLFSDDVEPLFGEG